MDTVTDLYSRHQLFSYRYGTGAYNRIAEALDKIDNIHGREIYDLIADLTDRDKALLLKGKYTTKRLAGLRDTIKQLSKEYSKATAAGIAKSGSELISYEIGHTEKVLAATANIPNPKPTSPGAVAKLARQTPLLGNHMSKYAKDVGASVLSMFNSEITDGIQADETAAAIKARIKGTAAQKFNDGGMARIRRKVETTTRTSLNHTTNTARDETLKQNGVETLIWRAVLDGRTSKVCASRDGIKYPVGKGPRPPAHPNCRSVMVAYLGHEPDGTRPWLMDKRQFGDIPDKERGGKFGNIKANQTYEDWFDKRTTEKFKKEWLGKSRYELYKSGKYKIGDFVDKTGKQYTLDQLKVLDAQALKDVGLKAAKKTATKKAKTTAARTATKTVTKKNHDSG